PPERLPFDYRLVEVKCEGNEWKLLCGRHVLANFGPAQHEARLAWNVLQHYRFTEQWRLGGAGGGGAHQPQRGGAPPRGGAGGGGGPPRGWKCGVWAREFRRAAVLVREVGGGYAVCEGDRVLARFGTRLAEAQQLVDVIRRHQFDHLCQVGGGADGYGMTFLVRK